MSRKRGLSDGEMPVSSRGRLARLGATGEGGSGAQQPSEVNVQETVEVTPQRGHNYSGITMSDQSRNHLGDNITVHHHTSPLSSDEVARARYEEFKEALAFERMDFRRANIATAYAQTCQWVFKEDSFLRWRDSAYRETNHGVLWIRGKPGSGKSTIMKLFLEYLQKQTPDSTIISFFFNARGHVLERTAEGCYRSLLHQLLESVATLRTSIKLPSYFTKGQNWETAVVQDFLRQALLASPRRHIVLLIDALDECNDTEVRDLVDFIDDLTQHSSTFDASFASRHYPNVTSRFCEKLVVESSEDHTMDIRRYIESRLHVQLEIQRAALAESLLQNSRGVFLWVVLVVRSINKQHDRGDDDAQLLASISAVPSDLDALISNVLSAEDGLSDRSLFPALLWTLTGHEHMSLEEMYTAIKSAAGVPHSLSRPSCSKDQMVQYVVHASRGLVEVTYDYKSLHGVSWLPFQFIHESVRQHLLAGALTRLCPGSPYAVEARIHTIGAEWCQNYIQSCDATDTDFPAEPSSGMVAWDLVNEARWEDFEASVIPGRVLEAFLFFTYACYYVFHHLNNAYVTESYDLGYLRNFPLPQWVEISNIFVPNGATYASSRSLLHLFSGNEECHSDPGIIRGLFEYCHASSSADLTEHDSTSQKTTDRDFSDMLLGRNLNDYCGGQDGTPLVALAWHGLRTHVELLLNHGADPNVYGGSTDVDDSGEQYSFWEPPLSAAAISDNDEYLETVELLLDRGASIDFQGGWCGSALAAAVYSKSYEMVTLLLSKGANAALKDSTGRNVALTQALNANNNHDIVALLLDHGACDSAGLANTLMRYVVQRCQSEAVEKLLQSGADPHIKDSYGRTALHYAAQQCKTETVKLLVRYGADPRAKDSCMCTTLHAMAEGGVPDRYLEQSRTELASYFLDLGVDVDALDHNNGTAIIAASARGFEDLVKLFLDKGANIHHKHCGRGTAIEAAKAEGHQTIVRMLAEAYIRLGLEVPPLVETPIRRCQSWLITPDSDSSYDDNVRVRRLRFR